MFLRNKDSRGKIHNNRFIFIPRAYSASFRFYRGIFFFEKKIFAAVWHVYFHRMSFARLRLSRFTHQINVNIEQSMSIAWIDIIAVQ